MSSPDESASAFFYAFFRLKLLQKEHFLNFQKSVHSEAILTGEKLQKTAHLETSGNVWKRQITIITRALNLIFILIYLCICVLKSYSKIIKKGGQTTDSFLKKGDNQKVIRNHIWWRTERTSSAIMIHDPPYSASFQEINLIQSIQRFLTDECLARS